MDKSESSKYELKLAKTWAAVLSASLGSVFACFELAKIEAQESSSFPVAWAILMGVWGICAITSALNAGAYFRRYLDRR